MGKGELGKEIGWGKGWVGKGGFGLGERMGGAIGFGIGGAGKVELGWWGREVEGKGWVGPRG